MLLLNFILSAIEITVRVWTLKRLVCKKCNSLIKTKYYFRIENNQNANTNVT